VYQTNLIDPNWYQCTKLERGLLSIWLQSNALIGCCTCTWVKCNKNWH